MPSSISAIIGPVVSSAGFGIVLSGIANGPRRSPSMERGRGAQARTS
jgi:hypothetical protein